MMKAVRYHETGPAKVLKVEEIPIPRPAPGQILVRLHAAGLNRVDASIRAGMIPLPLPVIPGLDAAGVVQENASGNGDFKKGDHVIVYGRRFSPNGTYTQYYLATPENLIHLPTEYTLEQGAALPTPFFTAYYNICINARAKADDVVLVNGASGQVGLCAIEIARALGCTVIGVAGNPEGLALIEKKGAVAISYKETDFVNKVRAAAGSKNAVDIILETQAKNIPKDLELIAARGRILLIGNPSKETTDFGAVLMKQVTIQGTSSTSASPEQYEELKAALDKALKTQIVSPVIFKVFPLEEVVKAHEELLNPNKATAGKLVLSLD